MADNKVIKTISVDNVLWDEAMRLASKHGLSLSSIINEFLYQLCEGMILATPSDRKQEVIIEKKSL